MYNEIKSTLELLATAPSLLELKQGIEISKGYFKETCKEYNQSLKFEIENNKLLVINIENDSYKYDLNFK